MSSVLMGPLCTQILGDYGADVIKVEALEGDVGRHAGVGRSPRMNSMYLAAGRNKRSVCLNVKHPEGRAALLKLAESSDLFVHNVRPQAMARAGLSYEDIRQCNPSIVYLSLVGFGTGGPYANRPAFDDVIQGAAGAAGLFTQAGFDAPAFIPANLADRLTGITAAHAAIAALFMRERTGAGQEVEVPMFETFVQTLLGDHLSGASFVPSVGPIGYSRILNPFRRPFKTADGYVAATPYNDKQYGAFFEAIGRAEMLETNPALRTQEARAANFEKVYGLLSEIMLERTTEEWVSLCLRIEVPCSEVKSLETLLDDEHLRAVDFFRTSVHPTEGVIREMRPSTSWSTADVSLRRHAPRLGEHTSEVLAEAGYAMPEIRSLLEAGAAWAADEPKVTDASPLDVSAAQ